MVSGAIARSSGTSGCSAGALSTQRQRRGRGRGAAALAPLEVLDRAFALELVQHFHPPREHARRQARQARDVDAVRAVRRTRGEPVQEHHLVARFAHRDVRVREPGQRIRELL